MYIIKTQQLHLMCHTHTRFSFNLCVFCKLCNLIQFTQLRHSGYPRVHEREKHARTIQTLLHRIIVQMSRQEFKPLRAFVKHALHFKIIFCRTCIKYILLFSVVLSCPIQHLRDYK